MHRSISLPLESIGTPYPCTPPPLPLSSRNLHAWHTQTKAAQTQNRHAATWEMSAAAFGCTRAACGCKRDTATTNTLGKASAKARQLSTSPPLPNAPSASEAEEATCISLKKRAAPASALAERDMTNASLHAAALRRSARLLGPYAAG